MTASAHAADPASGDSRRRRRGAGVVALAALAAVALLAAACGSDDGGNGTVSSGESDSGSATGATQKVTLVLDWTPNTNHSGFYLALQKGYYRDAGLDVEIVEPGQAGGPDGLQQMAAGNAQFAVSNAEALIPARAEGVPAVSVAAIIEHNTSSLVAPTDRGITRPRDLAGKTYGGFGGQLEDALVKQMVSCDGGDPSAVKFVEVGNVDYRAGFDQHAFDFVWVFDGWDVIRIRDIDGTPLVTLPFIDYPQCIPDWYTPLLATTETQIKDHPDLVRAFVGATAKGFADAMDDPAAATDALMTAAPESDRDLVSRSAEYLAPRYASSPAAWGQPGRGRLVDVRHLASRPADHRRAGRHRGGVHQRLPALQPLTIEVVGLQHAFGPLPVIERLDLRVADGGFVSLIGPSGCGKSTLLRVLAGLLVPSGGRAEIGGRSCVGQPGLVAFMPQRDTLLPWRRALGNATLGAEIAGVRHRRGAGGSRQRLDAARGRARELFGRFGLAGFEDSWPSQLSGGMRQRVALLRTLLADRDVLALDEPFGALDALTRRELQVWLATVLESERRTALLVTHDVDEALWLSDTVVVLSPRPARVRATIGVPFGRPRSPLLVADPAFGRLKAEVLATLEDAPT